MTRVSGRFGIALVLQNSQQSIRCECRKRHYMSQQFRGEQLDHRTDVYSLGCVLYEMLFGRLTFRDHIQD